MKAAKPTFTSMSQTMKLLPIKKITLAVIITISSSTAIDATELNSQLTISPEGQKETRRQVIERAASKTTKLIPDIQNGPYLDTNDYSGFSISVSGNLALVGAFGDDHQKGEAFIFERDPKTQVWKFSARLTPTDSNINGDNRFGYSVSLSGDRALIGAYRYDETLNDIGAAYIFEYDGTRWVETFKLLPSTSESLAEFGRSVYLSGDRAVVTAPHQSQCNGTVYVFDFDGTAWNETGNIQSPDDTCGSFGKSISLLDNRLLIGSETSSGHVFGGGIAYIFDFNGTTWIQSAQLFPSENHIRSARFGSSVSLNGNRALIGSSGDQNNGTATGAAYIFEFDGTNWSQSAKLVASDGDFLDLFGDEVVLYGNLAMVGATGDDDQGINAGAVYVFSTDGENWMQTDKLHSINGRSYDEFGVSISAGNDQLLVGAHGAATHPISSSSGKTYAFTLGDNNTWAGISELPIAPSARFDRFGYSVSLNGERALVGASSVDNLLRDTGAAYIFDLDSSGWHHTTRLTPADPGYRDAFGNSVSLSANRALIGAHKTGGSPFVGAAYIFDYDGIKWNETAKLTSTTHSIGPEFGTSVSLYGNRALIGAPKEYVNNSQGGSAYVFDYNGTTWNQTAQIFPTDVPSGSQFGFSVSLSGDFALIGAYLDDDNEPGSGSAYIYHFDGSNWIEVAKLLPQDGAIGESFGYSVSLSNNRALIGSIFDATGSNGSVTGSAYIFDFNGISWVETAKLIPTDGAAGDHFGTSVELKDDRAIIGAVFNGESGAAYVFEYLNSAWVETLKLTPTYTFNTHHGISVSLSGDNALVGAFNGSYLEDSVDILSGSAYVSNFPLFSDGFE